MISALEWRAVFADLDALPPDASPQARAERGRQLERVLHAMLAEADLSPRLAYRPKGEEIDGSFVISERTMLLEAKWTAAPQPASALYQFIGKINGKLVGTIGLFVSMSGVSSDAVDALIAGKQLNLILMDGDDLRAIASDDIAIDSAIRAKLRAAAETGAPFFPVAPGAHQHPVEDTRELVLVEGRLDARILSTLIESWGTRAEVQTVVPVGGPSNFVPIADALVAQADRAQQLVIVAEGDQAGAQRLIEQGLQKREIEAEVLMVEPSLEVALGLVGPGPGTEERQRQRLMALDDQEIILRIQGALGGARGAAALPAQVGKLFSRLGINPEL